MKILVACEESQAVCIEFRKLGHEAYSCDIQDCSENHPEWHLKMDVFLAIKLKRWDMMIAFPPCTHLCASRARWFKEGIKPISLQKEALDFIIRLMNADIPKIAIENPVGKISTAIRKPDQIINPYQFGHAEQKKTCLWLKGLPLLKESNNVYKYMMTLPIPVRNRIHWLGSNKSKERSKTFKGIAEAMAAQWSIL